MRGFVVEGAVDATPEVVFDVYTNHRGYPRLAKVIRAAELEREGDPAPNGVGAIRRLHLLGATVREEVTEYERPTRYSYRVLSGLPIDHYDATVTFTPDERGTVVAYRVSIAPSVRVLPVEFPTKGFVRAFMHNAAELAEGARSARSRGGSKSPQSEDAGSGSQHETGGDS